MFKFARSKREYENLYSVEVCNISKHFKIPHEKRNTVYENITGILKGKTYGYEDFTVLHDVSFTVGYGEALGIIGENGCGKSTLLKIIAGVLSPDEGSVKVGGKIAP
ncbi:MAG: ABC transporter ATP-binding protein, partial [Methanosarcinales archaeon]|nr:ABC transporter ATP-binding protein [Methanosarcinales archaeon]